MQGLELAERFYHEAVAPIIARRCPALVGRYAAGLIGWGSDVLGHDDELSRDHEWGPRGHLWLTAEDYAARAAALDAALQAELPATFFGYPTRFVVAREIVCLVPAAPGQAGGHHLAITTVARHLELQLGLRRLPPDPLDWLYLPEQKLLEFTRGRIFSDPVGEITAARRELAYFPDDIWRFRLFYAWQSLVWDDDLIGLCAQRGDTLSAWVALGRTVERLTRLIFLLARRYRPSTLKWLSRELGALPDPAPALGRELERCLALPDPALAPPILDEAIRTLVREHNRLGITAPVTLGAPGAYTRGQETFSLNPLLDALRASLPPALRDLPVQGAVDQWVTNDDILIWAERYGQLRDVYTRASDVPRDGLGDRIV